MHPINSGVVQFHATYPSLARGTSTTPSPNRNNLPPSTHWARGALSTPSASTPTSPPPNTLAWGTLPTPLVKHYDSTLPTLRNMGFDIIFDHYNGLRPLSTPSTSVGICKYKLENKNSTSIQITIVAFHQEYSRYRYLYFNHTRIMPVRCNGNKLILSLSLY